MQIFTEKEILGGALFERHGFSAPSAKWMNVYLIGNTYKNDMGLRPVRYKKS